MKCDLKLPDAEAGDRLTLQRNRKEHQRIYFECASNHNDLVDSLEKQGVSGKK